MKFNFFNEEGSMGVDERKNLVILFVVALVPFYLIILSALALDAIQLETHWIMMEVGFSIMAWIMIIMLWYVKVKGEITSLYVFDDAQIHFDENTRLKLDLKFKPNEMRQFEDPLPDGREIVLIPFTEVFAYEHPEYGLINWDKAIVVMPFAYIPFEHTFAFRTPADIWHTGMLAECPNCEGAAFHVSPFWEEFEGEWIPVFTVQNSHIHYIISKAQMMHLDEEAVLELYSEDDEGHGQIKTIRLSELDTKIDALELFQTEIISMKSRITSLKLDVRRLSEDREKLLQERVKVAEEAITNFYESDRRLMNLKPETKTKILNMKALAVLGAFGFAFAALLVLAYVFG